MNTFNNFSPSAIINNINNISFIKRSSSASSSGIGLNDAFANEDTNRDDFGVINEADEILGECNSFIKASESQLFMIDVKIPVAQRLRQWRVDRKNNKINSMYNELTPKLASSEVKLRQFINEISDKKTHIKVQARYLLVRLNECIMHNTRELTALTSGPIDDARILVDNLTSLSDSIKCMMHFNKEVIIQRVSEEMGFSTIANVSMHDVMSVLDCDPDNVYFNEYLNELREQRQKYLSYLESKLKMKETCISQLESCTSTYQELEGLMKSYTVDDTEKIIFNHDGCTNCLYSYMMSCECIKDFHKYNAQSIGGSSRLTLLCETREKISEIAAANDLE